MEHVIYVAVPPDDDADRLARAATAVAPEEFDFEVLEREEPREPTGVELAFRISGSRSIEEAIERALWLYRAAREEAGLPPDENPRASGAIWPASR